ncbi:palmitoyl-monogalactosyldiacylglycerol delta-7 desaturase, chloroplastic-like [Corylus avellana]|uniref:palmitoyl-monogalactosyldiacylglycerol delta-7 desaturase, chloroplastic-like n=1 Tax=Corylus avellana TaxID=13451 RepID=UPI001E23B060|nr:palmitoyl-monogalactosyldiacylglycerol delta-7 desaturase, chloroplastic-like [Corylus avellana]
MALIISPPSNPKPHQFSPLRRSSHRPEQAVLVSPRAVSNTSKVLNFGHHISKPKKLLLNTKFATHLRNNGNRSTVAGIASAALVEEAEPRPEPGAANYRRILLSDVVVTRQSRVFFGRKWNSMDIGTAGVVLGLHCLCLFAPFQVSWGAVLVAMALYVVTGLFGITLSYHRNLSHRSFKLPKWLEYLFAYCGALALQGSPIDWVSTHRYHHQFCDSERDPHSPTEGFWYSHMSWLFDTNAVIERCGEANNVADLQKQPFYRFLQRTYAFHPIALGVLLYALGGIPFLVWGMGVRIVWVYHITWLVNSACHVWGKQPWNTGDLSRNNWWVALLAFGEGWHNNHHAFEFSARHGLEWWQFDMTWYVIRFLQAIGLTTDVKLPTEVQKQRMPLNNGSMAI